MTAVNDLETPNREALDTSLAQANEQLSGLFDKLSIVDTEIESLEDERQRFELINEACDALHKLRELGATEYFWGKHVSPEQGDRNLREARARADVFLDRFSEIASRRESVLTEIQSLQETIEILEDELFEAQEEEERRKLEWIVEREISELPARKQYMPWTHGGEQDKRFRKSLGAALLVSLLLGLLLPLVDLPLPERWETIDVPERLARLVEKRQALPPPVVMEEVVPEQQEPEPLPEPEPVDEPLTPTDVPVLAQEQPAQPAPSKQEQEKPQSKGILAFREKFTDLAANKPSPKLGAQARISSAGSDAIGRPERAMVTTQAPGSSGGINLAALSRDVGGGGAGDQIAGVQLTRVASTIGGGGDNRPLAGAAGAGRTDEEIQIVFDRHKAALYRFYNRELRNNPLLQGQLVLRIRIEPDGSVSLCELHASDMDAPVLSEKVLGRVRTFDFGAKDVPVVTILYPIDFLPATSS